uniref:Uncharacterized protein n=1 Tax=Acrobeloides nanus TaxID=290746 RepID=A0A914DVX2_9BILA
MTLDDYKWKKAVKIVGKERFKCFSKDDSDFYYIFQRKERNRINYFCYFCKQIKVLFLNGKLKADDNEKKLIGEVPYISIHVDCTIALKKDHKSIDDGHFCRYFIRKGNGHIISNGKRKRIVPGNIEKNYGQVIYIKDNKNIITISKSHNFEISWRQYKTGKNHRLFHCIRCKELNAQFDKDSKRSIPYIKVVNDYIMDCDPDFPANDHFCFDAQVNTRKIAEKIPGTKQYRVPSAKSKKYYVFDYHKGSTYHCSDCWKIHNHGRKKDKDRKNYKLKYINIYENGVIIDCDVDKGHICGDIDTDYIEINSKRYKRNANNCDYGKAIFLNTVQTRVITTSQVFTGKKFVWSSYKKTPKYTLFKCVGCKKLHKIKVPFVKVIGGRLKVYNPDFPKYEHVCISNNLDQTTDMDIKRKTCYYKSSKSKNCTSPIHMITDITREQTTIPIKKLRKRIKKELIESKETEAQKRIAQEEPIVKQVKKEVKEREEEVKLPSRKTQETSSLPSDIANHNMEKEALLRQAKEHLKTISDALNEFEEKPSFFSCDN